MLKEAIYHKSDSTYAYPLDEKTLAIKLRAKKHDLKKVILCYGDRYDPNPEMKFYEKEMKIAYRDDLFDYYETEITPGFNRISYYFKLFDGNNMEIFALDKFLNNPAKERNRNYMFSHICRGDLFQGHSWWEESAFYLIFVDRFNKENIDESWYKKPSHHDIFGGNLKGITDKLNYLMDLGIDCIYLTPIFKSESNHKYDTIDYLQLDESFGDSESLKLLVEECHRRDIKVILDAVFNHTSHKFFAFQDLMKNKNRSEYRDWYFINDDGSYETFGSVSTMPKINTTNQQVKEYFFNMAEFWMKNFDIDGWRLDVANEIDHKFWREFRQKVKNIKRDVLLIGEAWDGAESYLYGDQFDSAMNYPFMYLLIDYFARKSINTYQFDFFINNLFQRYKKYIRKILLNLIDSHDTSRFLHECSGDMESLKMAVFFQMTCIGIPMVLYGDEAGISGGHEPDSRRTMDFNSINKELYNFYKKMISIRKENEPLKRGEFKTILVEGDVYAYSRYTRDEEIICIFNNGLYNAEISIPTKKNSAFDILNNTEYSISGGEICINTESKGKYVIKSV